MAFNIPGVPSSLDAKTMGNFDLGAALKSGLQNYGLAEEARYKPKTLAEELLGKHLTNKINEVKSKYAEDLAKATIAHQEALTEKANRGPAPVLNNLEKAQAGYERAVAQFGENSQQAKDAKAYAQRIAQGSNGVSISYDPETGQPLVQIGGSGGRGGQSGKLLQNPETGETYAQPTGAVATNLQNRIIGEEQLQPILQDIMEKVPQFQSVWTRIESQLEGKANEWAPKSWGVDFRLPSEQQGGKSALSKSAESMIKLYGLHANARNVAEVKQILEPGEGESAAGYKARVDEEVEKYMQSKLTAQNQLGHGVKVTEGGKPAGSSNNNKTYTWAGIESTARLNNLDPNVVVDRLAKKNNMTVDAFMKLVKRENS